MKNIMFLVYVTECLINFWFWWNFVFAIVEYYRQDSKTETLIRSMFAIICLLIMILMKMSNIAVG